jgi:hypothetical protein
MATNTPVTMAETAASTSSTTLYTSPSNGKAILTEIIISNTTTLQQNVTITVGGVNLLPAIAIPAASVVNFQFKKVINSSKIVAGFATSTGVTLHISGVESV